MDSSNNMDRRVHSYKWVNHITHSHILKIEEIPNCIPCQNFYTVKHIFDCIDLNDARKKF